MTVHISKLAVDATSLRRETILFESARVAFRTFLQHAAVGERRRVLLPAYIGWSSREGSGVLDPVSSLQLDTVFYRVDRSLQIDLEHLERELRAGPCVLVLIHYFGHVDPGYEQAVALGRQHGALVVEDEAHAMFTDLFGGRSGRLGDVCLYSLHKLLPMPVGGALVLNPGARALLPQLAGDSSIPTPWDFDLLAMARARKRNAQSLARLLAPLAGRVDPLWPLDPDEVPQTFPVKIRGVSRDLLYERMNGAGFGVVSLYHTMVSAIDRATFPTSYELAACLMNLPVHHEVTESALASMVEELGRQLDALESPT